MHLILQYPILPVSPAPPPFGNFAVQRFIYPPDERDDFGNRAPKAIWDAFKFDNRRLVVKILAANSGIFGSPPPLEPDESPVADVSFLFYISILGTPRTLRIVNGGTYIDPSTKVLIWIPHTIVQ